MKPLEKDEIFQNLSGFLKTRGIELKEGSYAQGIQKSCALLTNAINLGQQGFGRAKKELDKSVEHMRKVIHEKTAPKPPKAPPATATAPPDAEAKAESPAAMKPVSKPAKAKARTSKARKAGGKVRGQSSNGWK